LFGGKEYLVNVITKIRRNFEEVNSKYSHIKFIYLTYEEVICPKKQDSINYFEETKKYLGPKYKAFCLKDSRTGQILQGQWTNFVNEVIKHSRDSLG
jgi:hypothetical protein